MQSFATLWPTLTLRQRATFVAHAFKAVTRHHHLDLADRLRRFIPADAVVLDIGGHAGHYAHLFATLARAGRVYSFEPSPYACAILEIRQRLGRLPANIELIADALSDAPGMLELRTPLKRSGSLGFGRATFSAGSKAAVRTDRVAVATIDSFASARGLPRLDFIKLDIEGWEHHALRGGADSLRRWHPVLLAEVDDGMLRASGSSAADLWDFLADLGYRAARLSAPETACPAYAGTADYLFSAEAG